MEFNGFSPEASAFLWELRFNNERPWFNAHKEEFLALVDRPFRALADEVFERMQEAFPKREWYVHVSRIYRDARRLYGRGPYKDHLWFTLRCDASKDEEVPGFYFGFDPEGYDYGMGYWSSKAQLMERYRRLTLANPKPLETLARRLNKQDVFTLGGQSYKRPKVEHSPLLDPWLNRKWIAVGCEKGHDELSRSHDLADEIVKGFTFLVPYYDYFDSLRHMAD